MKKSIYVLLAASFIFGAMQVDSSQAQNPFAKPRGIYVLSGDARDSSIRIILLLQGMSQG